MRRLLSKLLFAFVFAAPLVLAQYTYFIVDKTMAGPPSHGGNWVTGNSAGTDLLNAAPPRWKRSESGRRVRWIPDLACRN